MKIALLIFAFSVAGCSTLGYQHVPEDSSVVKDEVIQSLYQANQSLILEILRLRASKVPLLECNNEVVFH